MVGEFEEKKALPPRVNTTNDPSRLPKLGAPIYRSLDPDCQAQFFGKNRTKSDKSAAGEHEDGGAREVANGQGRPDGDGPDGLQAQDHQGENGGRNGQFDGDGDADQARPVGYDENSPVIGKDRLEEGEEDEQSSRQEGDRGQVRR